jgi:hypothetical protein
VVDFGCDYCADDQNRFFGHVTQIADSEERKMILIRCPRCGTLYENTPAGEDRTRRLTAEEAQALFPDFRPEPITTARVTFPNTGGSQRQAPRFTPSGCD